MLLVVDLDTDTPRTSNDIELYIEEPLIKAGAKGKREGLIQTIVTYVRNGRVITRKQWVRSEFAQHAKKNEEERKRAMLRRAERLKEKYEQDRLEAQEEYDRHGEIERRKMERRQMQWALENTEELLGDMDEVLKEHYKRAKKRKFEEEEEKREEDLKRQSKKRKEEKEEKKEKKAAFGEKKTTEQDARLTLQLHEGIMPSMSQ